MEKLKVLSLFSGIGAFEKALENINANYELVGFSEIDKYAIESYCKIHDVRKEKNLGDVSKINVKDIPKHDLLTWGFPCTDLSIAGYQKGFYNEDGSYTRSGLYHEGYKILKEKRPKFSIIENVKALTFKTFKREFEMILSDLNSLGYNNYYKVLNAKYFKVPQNRERIFIVSIRKDVDTRTFEFPTGFEKCTRLLDILESNVDEKYYLSDEIQKRFKQTLFYTRGNDNSKVISIEEKLKRGGTKEDEGVKIKEDNNKVININVATKKGYSKLEVPGVFNAAYPSSKLRRGRVIEGGKVAPTITTGQSLLIAEYYKNKIQYVGFIEGMAFDSEKRVVGIEGISPTLTTRSREKILPYDDVRLRKLTPLESMRLMAFDDEDYKKIKELKISDTQIYKQAVRLDRTLCTALS